MDAAHIEAWADTQNDALTNGLALSKNAHRMFDKGLWSADDHLRILTAPHCLAEASPEAIKLATRPGHSLHVDPAANLRPAREFLGRRCRQHGSHR